MEGRGKGRRGGDNLGVTRGGGVGKGVIKRGITYDMTESDPTGPLKAIKNPNTSFSLLIHEMGPSGVPNGAKNQSFKKINLYHNVCFNNF